MIESPINLFFNLLKIMSPSNLTSDKGIRKIREGCSLTKDQFNLMKDQYNSIMDPFNLIKDQYNSIMDQFNLINRSSY